MAGISLRGVSRAYRGVPALRAVDLEVASGSLTVLCGPPAAGKSVLLRLLVGLERPDSGRILLDGRDITALPAAERRFGYVPQSFALFPHMSVFDNIAYPMALQHVPREEIARRMGQVAEVLRIGPLLQKRPAQLSGGEKQRAAIARGMLKNAEVFLLDDPLVGLDFKLRESLMEDLKTMRAALGATFLYATSDSLEALNMAEDLVVLDAGRVVDSGDVARVYHDPRHLRAAELVGFPRCNVLRDSPLLREAPGAAVVLRPEHIVAGGQKTGTVRLVEALGAESVVYFQAGEETLVTVLPGAAAASFDLGDPFPFTIRTERMMVFDPATGARQPAREALHA
jgi:multiple sugar transport system ATP-binding protein